MLFAGSLDRGRDVAGSAGHLTLRLSGAVTAALLTRVAGRYYGGIEDVLLTGLSLAVLDWCRRRGGVGGQALPVPALLVDVEGHGREDVFADVDLSRTVGWFTSLYPVRLDLAGVELSAALSGGSALGRALKRVKEQLRRLPAKGLGYGLLRYLNAATAGELSGFAAAPLSFNYLGRFAGGDGADWSGAAEGEGLVAFEPGLPLSHGLAVDALTLEGPDGPQLVANWTYAPALLDEGAVRALAEGFFGALAALAEHASQAGAGGHSPSDFALVEVSQDEIEELEGRYGRLEDILPLSPLQEGLLFHALYDTAAPDVYTVQLELELAGALEVAVLEASVQALLRRHGSLRACFWHEHVSRPVQVIVGEAPARWRLIDLSGLSDAARQRRLEEIVAADRVERFDVGAPPLIRFALIRLSGDRHRLLLSSHHLLMDGWSSPVVVRELLALYGRGGDGSALARVTPYREYLSFVAGQDRAGSLAYWRQTLSGLEEATRVAAADAGRVGIAPEQIELELAAELSAALAAGARAAGVTLNSLLQAMWGVLLGRLSARSDVVFGVTVAGRPAEVAGIESMVGLFINTLPLRLDVSPGQRLPEYLRRTQERQSELMAHQYVGLAEVQQAAGVGELFDTLLVFENYPVDRAGLAAAANGLTLAAVRGHDATHYPLSLMVRPGDRLSLRLDYRPDLFDRASVVAIGERLVRLLSGAVAAPDRAIGLLPVLSGAERAAVLEVWNATGRAVAAGTLPELFAAQAARTPEAVAVVYEERRLSYAALEAHANRLAHRLRGLGVGPDVLVGLCVERSPEMVIGLLYVESGRRLSAARPRLPGGAARRHALRCRGQRAGDAAGAGFAAAFCGAAGAHRSARRRLGRAVAPAGSAAAARPRPRPPGLCDLHLGLNRYTQRRRRHAWSSRQLPRRHAGADCAWSG